jgi:multimeric flavodoxin WrbA
MHIVAINGSPHKDGNTYIVLQAMAEELHKEGITTEIIQVGDKLLHGCTGCACCRKSENNLCVFKDDIVNEVSLKLRAADGFILGSPTYYGGVSGTMKCFLDRLFYSSSCYFKNKVATSVAVARRAGTLDAANQMNNFLKLGQIIMPASQYWPVVFGGAKGEVLQDLEGMQTVRKTARSMAWILKSLQAASLPVPEEEKRIMTNFIR